MKLPITLLSLLVAVPTLAGPFGLEQGMTLAQVEAKIGRSNMKPRGNTYHAVTVPLPNRAFSSYALKFSKRSGLCRVAGLGRTIEANRTGAQVKDEFQTLLTALTEKYGEPVKNFDFVHVGALFKDDDEFMWALYKGERTLASYWGNGESTLPGNLKTILIETSALSSLKGYVTVTYDFKNVDECDAEGKQVDNASL